MAQAHVLAATRDVLWLRVATAHASYFGLVQRRPADV